MCASISGIHIKAECLKTKQIMSPLQTRKLQEDNHANKIQTTWMWRADKYVF